MGLSHEKLLPPPDSMIPTLDFSENVLPFAIERMETGARVCIVTLVYIDGSSPRTVGTQMAISECGAVFGSFTGGCLEAAVVAEALEVMECGQPRLIRYGKGSPYLDIALPCGSGLDLNFDPMPELNALKSVVCRQDVRKPALLEIRLGDRYGDAIDCIPPRNIFKRWYLPKARLFVTGDSVACSLLKRLGSESGFDIPAAFTSRPSSKLPLLDRWSALVLMFHEHSKEDELLALALDSDCFYIGVLGSHETHARRTQRLKEIGFAERDIARLHAPIGLIPNAKTPTELAVSVLAEVMDVARK